jgi:ribosomal protein L21
MYAIIDDGGRQFKVEEGQELDIDYRDLPGGEELKFERVLAYSDDDGQTWHNSAGTKIGGRGELIRVDSPGIKVWDVNPRQGQNEQRGRIRRAAGTGHIRRVVGEDPLEPLYDRAVV